MSATSRCVLTAARVWALIIIGLHVSAPLMQERWAWGVWPATYLPVAWRWGLALLAAVCVLWGEALWRIMRARVLASPIRLSLASPWARLAVAAAAAIPFYLLRIRHLRWGDAELLVKGLADPYRLTFVWQAPLDVYIHARLWQWGNAHFGWPDPTPVYHVLSILAGVIFIYILLSLAYVLGRNRSERALFAGLIVTLGVIQLFFGYIENYPLMTVGVLLYAWLGLRALRGEIPLVWPATALAVTHAFHPSTIILVPSLLYLLWHAVNTGNCRSLLRPILSVALPYIVVFAGVVALMEGGDHGLIALATVDSPGGGDRRWLVPLFKVTTEWQHYTMFSLGHLIDIVNQQLLVAPVVWPMLVGSAVLAWPHLPLREAPFRFLLLMAAFYLLLTLTWNADYGGQKDWDLFSPAAIPAALLLAYSLPRVLPERRALRSVGWALIAAQGFHAVTWILRNMRPQ